ncbi:MAG TPA: hypothetical protein GX690_01990 [Tenericutes bacterium]|jgi:hypothetical protein|nr:hypothetical protein [Mycoplasmatota bacterium]
MEVKNTGRCKELLEIKYSLEKLKLKKTLILKQLKNEWSDKSKEFLIDIIKIYNPYPNVLLLNKLSKEELLDNLDVFL